VANRFQVPFGISVDNQLRYIEDEINRLRERLDKCEEEEAAAVFDTFLAPERDAAKECLCDAEYVGMHKWNCRVGRGR
jgi:hypothetical protein